MKKLSYLLLLIFSLSVVSLRAQNHWTVSGSYRDQGVVYAEIVNNENAPADFYEVGAFIDGECRGAAEAGPQGQPYFFYLNIGGDPSQDNGKDITFKVYNKQTQKEYVLKPESDLKWASGNLAGNPNILFKLYLTVPTAIALPANIELNVGETLNLRQLISVTPADAVLPEGKLNWSLGNYPNVASIDANDVLTAQQPITNAELWLFLDNNVTAMANLTINDPVIPLDHFDINVGETIRGRESAIALTPLPADATIDVDKISVEVIPVSGLPDGWNFADVIPEAGDQTGLRFSATPILPGKATVVVSYDGQPAGSKDIDVGMPFSVKEGWQWITLTNTSIGAGELNNVFGTGLVEIRSQGELLYNDPQSGYFGSISETGIRQNECYKVKMTENRSYILYGTNLNLNASTASLGKGWTWIHSPYNYDRRLADVLLGSFTEGDRVVSKNDGFAEYANGRWQGTLSLMRAGEGYMFFNGGGNETLLSYPGEAQMAQGNDAAAKSATMDAEWNYDAAGFSDNMSMVAQLKDVGYPDNYTIGAFVGNECRGEGKVIDERLFITIHGNLGEKVNFVARNKATNECFTVEENVVLQRNLGSIHHPFLLNLGNQTTGIEAVNPNLSTRQSRSWNLQGVEMPVCTPQKGVRLMRHSDGTTLKIAK